MEVITNIYTSLQAPFASFNKKRVKNISVIFGLHQVNLFSSSLNL